MPDSTLYDMGRSTGIGDERALQLALELTMLGFNEPLNTVPEPESPGDLSSFVNPLANVGIDEVRSKKSQNMTECVPVPSSEHVAEIVGRQGRSIFTFSLLVNILTWRKNSKKPGPGFSTASNPFFALIGRCLPTIKS